MPPAAAPKHDMRPPKASPGQMGLDDEAGLLVEARPSTWSWPACSTAFQLFTTGAGYRQGATVFVDLNQNGSLDDGEPSATTDEQGRFSLTGVTDPVAQPLIASVPDGAIDSYTGSPVGGAYVLGAPVGAGTFISPLSSLVAGLLRRYPSFTLDEAAATLRAQLALSDGTDLFGDYVRDSTSGSVTAIESQKLQRIARVLATSYAIDQARFAAARDTAAEPSDVFAMVTENAEAQLPTIVKGTGDTELDEDSLRAVGSFLQHIDTGSIEVLLDRSRRATKADFFETFVGDGADIPFPGPNGAVAGYGSISRSSADRQAYSLPQQDFGYDIATAGYLAEPASADPGYNLTPDGWLLRTESVSPVFASNDDGSASESSPHSRAPQTVTSNAVDLSGHLIPASRKP